MWQTFSCRLLILPVNYRKSYTIHLGALQLEIRIQTIPTSSFLASSPVRFQNSFLFGCVINSDSDGLTSIQLKINTGFNSKMKPVYGSQNYYKGLKPHEGFQLRILFWYTGNIQICNKIPTVVRYIGSKMDGQALVLCDVTSIWALSLY